jgi:hypothetical protein
LIRIFNYAVENKTGKTQEYASHYEEQVSRLHDITLFLLSFDQQPAMRIIF